MIALGFVVAVLVWALAWPLPGGNCGVAESGCDDCGLLGAIQLRRRTRRNSPCTISGTVCASAGISSMRRRMTSKAEKALTQDSGKVP